jgi:hypothetical protein
MRERYIVGSSFFGGRFSPAASYEIVNKWQQTVWMLTIGSAENPTAEFRA